MGQMDGGDGGGGHQYHYQALLAAVHQQTLPFPHPLSVPAGPEAPPHNAAPQPPTPRGFADWSASTSAFTSLATQSSPAAAAAATNSVHYSISPCYAFWTHYMLNKNVYPSFPPPQDEQPHQLRLATNHPKDAGSASSFGVDSFTTVSMAPNICAHMPPIEGPISVKEEKKPKDLPRVVKRSDELETRNSGIELHSETVGTLSESKQGPESRATKLNSGEYQVILRKELTKSDVGNVGRIVLPKKDAEASLPPLVQRDPVILHMDDMVLPVTWKFKYRYWPNNKSRMYILDSAGEFLKTHGLQAGDVLIIYKNLAPGKFIIRGEKAIHQQSTNP